MTDLEKAALNAFKSENTKYKKKEIKCLKEALENYFLYEPSKDLKKHLEQNPEEPLQVVRDRKIVDYLYKVSGLKLDKAVDLWSDWEDYEHVVYQALNN
jgi:hypothetical protein